MEITEPEAQEKKQGQRQTWEISAKTVVKSVGKMQPQGEEESEQEESQEQRPYRTLLCKGPNGTSKDNQ